MNPSKEMDQLKRQRKLSNMNTVNEISEVKCGTFSICTSSIDCVHIN